MISLEIRLFIQAYSYHLVSFLTNGGNGGNGNSKNRFCGPNGGDGGFAMLVVRPMEGTLEQKTMAAMAGGGGVADGQVARAEMAVKQ